MKTLHAAPPLLALALAGLFMVPGREALGFSKIGGSLLIGQRDFRVFDNFADPTANDNVTPDPNWPGWLGVELAIWKGYLEWGSGPHGDGSGDPTQPNVGDGKANFDPAWMGSAADVGGTNHNIVSAQTSCGGGTTLAFTETPISDGWRIRFCDDWVWADGPGQIGFNQADLQGVGTHEFGHALGLGHSSALGATMRASTSLGSTSPRSINDDDMAGIQCIYGVKSETKPEIFVTDVAGSEINVYGVNFTGTDLYNVWFTNANVTATTADPRVRVLDVAPTSPNLITVSIPADAGPGDVLVQRQGGSTGDFLSNAFPSDLVTTLGEFTVANVDCPAELGTDPVLADTGGDGTIGPKIDHVTETFNLTLDCSNAGSAGAYTMVLRLSKLGSPSSTAFGSLWQGGPKLFKCSGIHALNTIDCIAGGIVLPNEPSFVGIEYTAQGFCDGSNPRLSNAIVQVVGL